MGSFPGGLVVESACQWRRCKKHRFNRWQGRSPGGGNGNPLQYSCLGNPMDRGTWWATVHGVSNSWTWQSVHAQDHGQFWEVVEESLESFCFHVWWWVWSHSRSAEPEVREQRDLLIHLTVVKTEQSRSGKQPKDALLQAVCLSYLYLLSATHV